MEHQKAIDHIIDRMRRELPDNLKYHSIEHTLSVLKASRNLAEKQGVHSDDLQLLLTAAAYHDSGFMFAYKNHEETSCRLAGESLPEFGFTDEQIEIIKGMIMATKIPQNPKNQLEKIICDADLDYLGRDNYEKISEGLYDELGMNGVELSKNEWLELQIKFLEEHHYWTNFYIQNLAPEKERVLERLKAER